MYPRFFLLKGDYRSSLDGVPVKEFINELLDHGYIVNSEASLF